MNDIAAIINNLSLASASDRLEAGLYVVSTPIGNLQDITLRALQILAKADIIACEDTRVSIKLLNNYGIKSKLVSYHEHNEEEAAPRLLEDIKQGKSVALISDAGTPLISDPGFKIVRQARMEGVKLFVIPGACAITTALVGSGLANSKFLFAGFLPNKKKQRLARLVEYSLYEACSLIFYESPYRLVKTLEDMIEIFGKQREAAICRELTKLHETYDVSSLEKLWQKYASCSHKIGEIVIIISPKEQGEAQYNLEEAVAIAKGYLEENNLAKAASLAAKETKIAKKLIYNRLVQKSD